MRISTCTGQCILRVLVPAYCTLRVYANYRNRVRHANVKMNGKPQIHHFTQKHVPKWYLWDPYPYRCYSEICCFISLHVCFMRWMEERETASSSHPFCSVAVLVSWMQALEIWVTSLQSVSTTTETGIACFAFVMFASFCLINMIVKFSWAQSTVSFTARRRSWRLITWQWNHLRRICFSKQNNATDKWTFTTDDWYDSLADWQRLVLLSLTLILSFTCYSLDLYRCCTACTLRNIHSVQRFQFKPTWPCCFAVKCHSSCLWTRLLCCHGRIRLSWVTASAVSSTASWRLALCQ